MVEVTISEGWTLEKVSGTVPADTIVRSVGQIVLDTVAGVAGSLGFKWSKNGVQERGPRTESGSFIGWSLWRPAKSSYLS